MIEGESITERTDRKIKQNSEFSQPQLFILGERIYTVDPQVFSPNIFLGTEWQADNLTEYILYSYPSKLPSFIEIGVGCGCILAEVALRCKVTHLYGADISPHAVKNSEQNLKKFQIDAQVYVSDVLDGVPNETKFDMIFWNYPFHQTQTSWEGMSWVEKSVRDQDYRGLAKLLQSSRLSEGGEIILGFSETMGDWDLLGKICSQNKYAWKKIAQMSEKGTICLLKLTRM